MTSFASSGDLSADRRYLWADASRKEGDLIAAVDLFAQAVELAPHWPAAWFALGEVAERSGDAERARVAFRTCLELAPDDPFGAGLHLSRLEGATAAQMPGRFVSQLFDDYADRFDDHLTMALAYRGPDVLREALRKVTTARPLYFPKVCDLGCGTGLMGAALDGMAGEIDGVDLSTKMLAKARATGRYHMLVPGDVTTFLAAATGPAYDLVIAADVFVYLGDLQPVLTAAARRTKAQGLLAFTVQSMDGVGYTLGADMRYAHSAAYLRDCAAGAGWQVALLEPSTTRKDAGQDVPGFVVVLSRNGA